MGIKRFTFLIILILLFGLVGLVMGGVFSKKEGEVTRPVASGEPTPSPEPIMVKLNDISYEIYFQEIKNELSLIPNFSAKKSSQAVFKDNECAYGANGGFYTKEEKPLGLFAVGGKIFGKEIKSATFNGFFYKRGGKMYVDKNAPEDVESLDFIVQSGPLVDLEFLGKGTFVDEENRRRVLVVKDKGDRYHFAVIFEKDSSFSGPKLVDIAEILRQSKYLDFDRALNLDGGSASVFYQEKGISLGELSYVGSFFCGK